MIRSIEHDALRKAEGARRNRDGIRKPQSQIRKSTKVVCGLWSVV